MPTHRALADPQVRGEARNPASGVAAVVRQREEALGLRGELRKSGGDPGLSEPRQAPRIKQFLANTIEPRTVRTTRGKVCARRLFEGATRGQRNASVGQPQSNVMCGIGAAERPWFGRNRPDVLRANDAEDDNQGVAGRGARYAERRRRIIAVRLNPIRSVERQPHRPGALGAAQAETDVCCQKVRNDRVQTPQVQPKAIHPDQLRHFTDAATPGTRRRRGSPGLRLIRALVASPPSELRFAI